MSSIFEPDRAPFKEEEERQPATVPRTPRVVPPASETASGAAGEREPTPERGNPTPVRYPPRTVPAGIEPSAAPTPPAGAPSQPPQPLWEGDLFFDDLVIRPRLRVAERDGVPIDLSANEFDLLYFLASHPRQVFTRQQLLDRVWHYEYFGGSSTVTVHMSRLRKKVEPNPAKPRHLRTVWRVGYKFEP